MGYDVSVLHAWHLQGRWKDHLVLATQRRYFKVLIIRLRIVSCKSLSITSCSQTKIAWFDINGSVEDENVPRNYARSPWASPKHQKQIQMHRQKEATKNRQKQLSK